MSETIKLFGTDWCMKSAALRNYMQSKWIEFEDFNVDIDTEAETFVRSLYEGKLKFPTVVKGNKHVKNPTIKELDDFLEI
ncbi:glutaredoxin family protein [uncultured Croceitalea sp.]|uniref:glutaredoxin family protein n=1 Tax=uncultured Croceitalea sp. TaxID=1798908 RepID=UPI003305E0D6